MGQSPGLPCADLGAFGVRCSPARGVLFGMGACAQAVLVAAGTSSCHRPSLCSGSWRYRPSYIYRSKTDSNYSIMAKFRNREHHRGLPGLFRAPADQPWGSFWACARCVRTIRDLKLEFFALSCPCKPWGTVQVPRGGCRPPVEAPHLFCCGLMALSGARPRRAGAVTAAAVPRHPPRPLPGAGSGIGLGYYSNAAFLPN